MKKTIIILGIIAIVLAIIIGINTNKNYSPKELYKVYLEGEVIGVIQDKKTLEQYIDNQGNEIKNEYNVDTVYAPNTLEIKKVLTYSKRNDSVEDLYSEISKRKDFAVRGWQFTITNENGNNVIYVLDKQVFYEAIKKTIETFVGSGNYSLYEEDKQLKIETTGIYYDNIYLEDNIHYKETIIPVSEKIYQDVSELSKFLLFGTTEEHGKYTVQIGDTIETVAEKNKISTGEFLISNPEFKSKDSLLFPGQEVVIGVTNPQIMVAVEEYMVQDSVIEYKTEYKYDPKEPIGYEKVLQQGEKGLERIARKLKKINGNIITTVPVSREPLKPAINAVVVKGEKAVPEVGNLKIWSWPTASGWIITQNYEYRINPVTFKREYHQAIDIAIGHGAHIYAANNGRVIKIGYDSGYGNYIIVNHNNGYYTLYAHLSRALVKVNQVVASGSLIAYMGSTGISTGPHLHFEVWIGEPHRGGYKINPWNVLK